MHQPCYGWGKERLRWEQCRWRVTEKRVGVDHRGLKGKKNNIQSLYQDFAELWMILNPLTKHHEFFNISIASSKVSKMTQRDMRVKHIKDKYVGGQCNFVNFTNYN